VNPALGFDQLLRQGPGDCAAPRRCRCDPRRSRRYSQTPAPGFQTPARFTFTAAEADLHQAKGLAQQTAVGEHQARLAIGAERGDTPAQRRSQASDNDRGTHRNDLGGERRGVVEHQAEQVFELGDRRLQRGSPFDPLPLQLGGEIVEPVKEVAEGMLRLGDDFTTHANQRHFIRRGRAAFAAACPSPSAETDASRTP
jgi:hypothetical protein